MTWGKYKRKNVAFGLVIIAGQLGVLWLILNQANSSYLLTTKKGNILYEYGSNKELNTKLRGCRCHMQNKDVRRAKSANNVLTANGKLSKLLNASPLPNQSPKVQTKNSTPEKPSIDIVNDYYPYVDFKFVFPEISPEIDTTQKYFITVLVNTGANGDKYRRRRETIRQTWGNQSNCEQRKALGDEKLKDLRWLLVFVVGKAGPWTNDDELNIAEARQHNDMLIGNITDNYLNNIIKFYMGQVWASRFDIKYTMKTDDDVYVRIPGVIQYLQNAQFPTPFYGGWTYAGTRVNRVIGAKWTVSWKYYGEVDWPRFNPGAFFILSSDLLNKLFNYVYRRKPFHTDDVYVGVAMRDFGVKITTIHSFRIDPDMNKHIPAMSDCDILAKKALGHNIDPQASKLLFNRLESLCNKNIQC